MDRESRGMGTGGTSGFGDIGSTGRSGAAGGTSGASGADFGSPSPDSGTRAGSYDRKFTEHDEGGLKNKVEDRIEEGRERLHDAVETGRERLHDASETGRNRLAGQLESLGDRLEERGHAMEDAGGVQRRAGQVAVRASHALDSSADYLRSHDAAEMRDDLERAIRERPLMSVGVALGAGFLLARLLRD